MENNEKESIRTVNEIPILAANDEEHEEINYRGIKAMPFIIGNETFEKLGAIGTLSNLQVYLTAIFNMKRISATTLLNVFNGTTNIATLVGAYLCDTYFGRYNTLGFASIASLFGLLVITLTAAIKNMHPPHCAQGEKCIGPDAGQMAFLLFGFGLMIIGAGGIRPCNMAFVEHELVDRISHSDDLYVGVVFLFFVGTKIYVKVRPEGSPMTSLVQVMVVAVKKKRLKLPKQPWLSLFNYTPPKSVNSRLAYTEQFSFLDKAAIITPEDHIKPDGSAENPWNLCSIQQIEEAKCVIRVIPISLTAILYHIGVQQQVIVPVHAANHKARERHHGPSENGDRLIHNDNRVARRAFVEERRRASVSSMSAMWLVPQLALGGLAERSTPSASSISSYVYSFLISVVHRTTEGAGGNWLPEDLNEGRLDYFYYLVAVLCALNFGYFVVCARWYRYKGTGDSSIVTVEMESKKSVQHLA
ncbi:hypothetical protein DH2020_013013 [Rehmannia glutinosa]|uniref:Uncharacterized protein n=1 Tax=Rehmannia glutinosa TaxID=99300 RepID=A0ABR0X467_REHGL